MRRRLVRDRLTVLEGLIVCGGALGGLTLLVLSEWTHTRWLGGSGLLVALGTIGCSLMWTISKDDSREENS